MPRLDHDVVAAHAKRKKQEEEEKRNGNLEGQPPVAGSPPPTPQASPSRSVGGAEHIHVIHLGGPPPKKVKVDVAGSSSAPPLAIPIPTSPFAGIDNFKVDSPITAFKAGNGAMALVRALALYAREVGEKSGKEEALKAEIAKLKKSHSDLKKSVKEAERVSQEAEKAKKKIEDDLVASRAEGDRSKLKVQEQEMQMMEQKKDAEDQISALKKEVEEITEERVAMFEEGYNLCIGHVKHLSPDFDTSELYFTKKIVDGKLVDAAP